MKLISVDYSQYQGTPREWRLKDFTLGDINLVVGKNASGKSWTLNIVKGLASLLAGESKPEWNSGSYVATFREGEETLRYELRIENKTVVHESLGTDESTLLTRGPGGAGTIRATELGQDMKFQTPETELAAVARRDSIQHPFLERLFLWGKRLYYYPFGTSLGRENLGMFLPGEGPPPDTKNATQVVGIFKKADKELGDAFRSVVVSDMTRLGYPLESVSLAAPTAIEISSPFPGRILGLAVKEESLSVTTEQTDMSQGMFRALSLVIQLNYGVMSAAPSTIIIDDIGEGLDFERSCSLIELVMEKAQHSNVQLIMATNDRFVMNHIPIEAWSVLKRVEHGSQVHNYQNSRELFEAFKYTGLNNFDFLAADFLANAEVASE